MTVDTDDDRDRPHAHDGTARAPLPVGVWTATWQMDADGSPIGVTVDDGCLVFLCMQANGGWAPMTHIPRSAFHAMARILAREDGQ